MISKTQLSKRVKRKRNPELVETINLAKKHNYLELAKKLSSSTRKQTRINLDQLDELKENKIIAVGKVLGQGKIIKKKSIAALAFSKQALEKLKKTGCEATSIKQQLEKGKLKDVKIV